MGQPIESYTLAPEWNEFDFESMIAAYLDERPNERPATKSSKRELSRVLLKTLEAWAENRLAGNVPESFVEFEQRVRIALSMATAQAGPGRKVLVVSSGGPISMALRQVLMVPPFSMIQMNIQTRNSSFSHLYFNETNIQLSGFNHTPHLDHPDRRTAVTYY
jgi:broad specificity phosphatase PhoE